MQIHHGEMIDKGVEVRPRPCGRHGGVGRHIDVAKLVELEV